jgi:hypothetical protein
MDGITYLALYLVVASIVLQVWGPLCVVCALCIFAAVALRQRG